ncbi:hypothetical protein CWI80_09035 [Pseudidiomarina sediminum]|uniref:Bifunctional diguanylate cyclase/phosphodiesterase n=1 Tax=Pseudidiomarina sediminum TaxID=431675 RepID=A0A432Z456_9GAMM|nr:bifunctional diguanylate cyclase/phosphodiesterase [Pseudidiomarina sediminum]RUO72676.1 hypothetical protein CWI80_09035 [Pseudidiomarina sediminum]
MLYRRSLALSLVNVTLFVTICATFVFGILGVAVNTYTQPATAFERIISSASAIVALATAIALFAQAAKRRVLQISAALLVIVIATHSLLLHLSIDSLFQLEFLGYLDAYFYPPVASTFVLLGFALLLNPRHMLQRRWLRAASCILLVMAITACALHFVDDGFAYLGPHPPVTSLAAVMLLLVSLSLFLVSARQRLFFRVENTPATWLTFFFIALICGIWYHQSLAQIKSIRHEAVDTIEKVAKVRQQTVAVNVQILNRLRERWQQFDISPLAEAARFDSASYLRDIPHYLAIHMLDKYGRPVWQQQSDDQRDYLRQLNQPEVQNWLMSAPEDIAMLVPSTDFRSNAKPLGFILMPVGYQADEHYSLLVVVDLMQLLSPETRLLPSFLKIYVGHDDERTMSFDTSKPRHRNELLVASATVNLPHTAPLLLTVSLYSFDNLSNASNLRMIVAFLGFMFCISFLVVAQQNRQLQQHSLRLKNAQRRMQEQQRDLLVNEQQFRSLFTFHPDAIYSLDTEGTIINANHAVFSTLQHDPEQVIGSNFVEFLHPEDVAHAQANFKASLNGESVQYQLRVYNSQKALRFIDITSLPIKINGAITGVFGIAKDTTAQRQQDERLHVLERSIHASTNGIVISDAQHPSSPITYTNETFQRMTGYSAKELEGRSCDFLIGPRTNPATIEAIGSALNNCTEYTGEVRHYRKDGTSFWDELQLAPVADSKGTITHFIGIHQDITERVEGKAQLAFQAEHDALTQLLNRNSFERRLATTLHKEQKNGLSCFWAVLFIDLDSFKPVNEAMGLASGDEVLKQVAQRLNDALEPPHFMARFGGDEFVVALSIKELIEAERIGNHLLELIAEPYEIRKQKVYITASIGVSCYCSAAQSAVDLIQQADRAMTMAKRQGRNHLCFYNRTLEHHQRVDVHLRNQFQQAIDQERLQLFYQPIVHLASGNIVGVEALMRWQLNDGSFIAPDKFIPMAEATGQIIPASQWAFSRACEDLQRMREKHPDLRVAVNLSALQFHRANFFDSILDTVASYGLSNNSIELELTETILMDDSKHAVALIEKFRDAGFTMAIDDFGTGFSSLSYLKQLPVSKLKIDRAFIQEVCQKSSDEAIVRGILAMARQLDIAVVAEGIETAEQAVRLTELGCEFGQGYFFAKPKPLDELLDDLT